MSWLRNFFKRSPPQGTPYLPCGVPHAFNNGDACRRPAVLVVRMKYGNLIMCDQHNPFKDHPDFLSYLRGLDYDVISVEEAIIEEIMSG